MNWTFKPILITMIYLILLSKMNCFGFSSPTQWWTVNRTANSIQVDSAKNSIIFTTTESLDTTEDIPDNSSSSPGITTTLYPTRTTTSELSHLKPVTTTDVFKKTEDCVTLANGTERCYEKCTGEGQLGCQNDGVCVLDEKKNQMCRCPESSAYTGPHCDVHKTPSPEDRPCSERRYFIILIVACVIMVILIITTIAIFIYFRRRHLRYSKNRDNLQFDLTSSDIRNSAGSARDTDSGFGGHTNNIYFEAMDRTSQTAQGEPGAEETESSSTYSASIQHNIYASIAEDNDQTTFYHLQPCICDRGVDQEASC